MKEINYKVVSYCAIPEEFIENSILSEAPCDVFIIWTVSEGDEISDWIVEKYPIEYDEEIMIEMDY